MERNGFLIGKIDETVPFLMSERNQGAMGSNGSPTRKALQRILILGASLSLVLVSLLAILTPPANGYEWSIYRAMPDIFWGALIFGLIACIFTILFAATEENHYWKYAFVIVLSLYLLFLSLPLFRGYYLYGRPGADIFAHIGYTKTIIQTGHFWKTDWYPAIHFLFALLRYWKIPLEVAPIIVSISMVELYMVGLFLYIRQEFNSHTRILATIGVSVPILFIKFLHTTHPAVLSFFLFPIVLFLYKKFHQTTVPWKQAFLLILLGGLIVIFHPITILIIIISFFMLFISDRLYHRLNPEKPLRSSEIAFGVFFLGLFSVWYFSFERTTDKSMFILRSLFGETGATTITTKKAGELQAAPNLYYILKGLIEGYGPLLLYSFIAIIGLWIITSRILDGKSLHHVDLEFGMHYIAGVVIAVTFITLPLIVGNPIRVSRYMIVGSVLIAGMLVSYLLTQIRTSKKAGYRVLLFGVIFVIVLSVPLGVMNSYNTGKSQTSWTKADYEGSQWLVEKRDSDIYAISHDSSYKLVDYHTRRSGNRDRLFVSYNKTVEYPKHFGYNNHETLAATFEGRETYLVTKEYDQLFLFTQRKYRRQKALRYTDKDLNQVARDQTVYKIYTNGGYQTWLVNGSTYRERG